MRPRCAHEGCERRAARGGRYCWRCVASRLDLPLCQVADCKHPRAAGGWVVCADHAHDFCAWQLVTGLSFRRWLRLGTEPKECAA